MFNIVHCAIFFFTRVFTRDRYSSKSKGGVTTSTGRTIPLVRT